MRRGLGCWAVQDGSCQLNVTVIRGWGMGAKEYPELKGLSSQQERIQCLRCNLIFCPMCPRD